MGWTLTPWPLLIRDTPDAARKRMLGALRESRGVIPDTARRLELGERTVHTYLDVLGLRDEAMKIRLDNGIPPRGRMGPRRNHLTKRSRLLR